MFFFSEKLRQSLAYTVLAVVGTILLATLFWWFKQSLLPATTYSSKMIAIGRLSGLVASFGVLIQVLLMSKIKEIENIFRYDLFLKIHKYNGYTIFFALMFHPIFLIMGYRFMGQPSIPSQFWIFVTTYPEVLKALIATILLFCVVGASISFTRNRIKYEYWYWLHLTTYLAIILAFSHQYKNGGEFLNHPLTIILWWILYMTVATSAFYFRFLTTAVNYWRYNLTVEKVVKEADNYYSIYLTGKNLNALNTKAGQFFNWRFLSRQLWYESHPFSISKSTQKNQIRITFKELGKYTKKLVNIKAGTKLIFDGPHGSFTLDGSSKNNIVMIGGGVGVTPLRSLLDEVPASKKATLIYSTHQPSHFIFKDEFNALTPNCKIIYYNSKEKGRLTAHSLKNFTTNKDTDFYICGPVGMIKELTLGLKKLGVPIKQIHSEGFVF